MIFIKMIDDNLYTQGVFDAGSLQCCARHCVRAGVLVQKCITKTQTKLVYDFHHIKIEQQKRN